MTTNSTTYHDFGNPPIVAAWLNDVNTTVYTALGDGSLNPPATPAQVLANIGAVGAASPTFTGTVTVTGNETVSGTLGVTGATTLGNATVGGTLGVTGLTSLVNATLSGTLGVTGQTTLGAATGVTPTFGDNSTKLATTAFLVAAGVVPIPVGQCRLNYTSTTVVTLVPFNGNKIMINGAYQAVPSAGTTLTSPTMTTTTLYYIYAFMVSTTLTLEASTTTHATDATTGVEIKSGDATRTLVGMVYCDGVANQFTNTAAKRYVRTWFNDPGTPGFAFFSTNRTVMSTTPVEVNTEIRNNFIAWLNETQIFLFSGTTFSSVGPGTVGSYLAIDGVQADGGSIAFNAVGSADASSWSIPVFGLSEGLHYATVFGTVSSGQTGNYIGGSSVGGINPRCTLSTYTHK